MRLRVPTASRSPGVSERAELGTAMPASSRLTPVLLVLVILCLACAHLSVEGPAPADPCDVVAVEVIESDGSRHTILDPEPIRKIARSYAVSRFGWEEVRPGVRTSSRFVLVSRDGSRQTYWIGANGDLGIFPCYRFCSGIWVGVARDQDADGPTLTKGLADTQTFLLFQALER